MKQTQSTRRARVAYIECVCFMFASCMLFCVNGV